MVVVICYDCKGGVVVNTMLSSLVNVLWLWRDEVIVVPR